MTDEISCVAQSDALAQLYDSQAVSSKCIRLLQISACDGSQGNDTPLRCHLYVADLEAAPAYAALSYVWGTFSSPPQHVYCNDVAVPVTTNCYSALQHLRAMLGTFTIWIDVICINQKEVKDKMHQIGIMDDIYSKAQTTYVWLGEGTATTDRVMAYLGRAGFLEYYYQDSQSMTRRYKKPRVCAALMSHYKSRWGFAKSTMPFRNGRFRIPLARSDARWASLNADDCRKKELEDFLNCTWMRRIWTFQEIILSPNPIVVCGHSRLAWTRLEHSVLFLLTIDMNSAFCEWADIVLARNLVQSGAQKFTDYSSNLQSYADFCVAIGRLHQWFWWKPIELLAVGWYITSVVVTILFDEHHRLTIWPILSVVLPLLYCTIQIVSRLAPYPVYQKADRLTNAAYAIRLRSNLHDRMVQALRSRSATDPRDMSWGLLSILKRMYGDAPTTDFELPLPIVYQQLTEYLISKGAFAHIINLAAQKHCNGAPSWVPDYSEKLKDITYHDAGHSGQMVKVCQRIFGSQPCYKFHDAEQRILAVKGFVLGQITVVEPDQSSRFTTVKTAFYVCAGPPSGAQVGDKLVLIAGLLNPLVLRDNGQTMDIITATTLSYGMRGIEAGLRIHISLASAWTRYEKRRKEEWMQAQGWDARRSDSRDPDPLLYLEDILIS